MAAGILGLDLTVIKEAVVDELLQLPEFLLHPRRTFQKQFRTANAVRASVAYAAVMLVLSAAAGAALGLAKSVEASSVVYLTVGTLTVWTLYALFLHLFVFLLGGRQGLRATVATYLFVIGTLQPLLVALLWILTQVVPDAVTYRDVVAGLGGSAGAQVLVSGRFFASDVAAYYRLVASLLILTYFGIGIAVSHRVRWWRAALASFASFVFFVVAYAFLALLGELGAFLPLNRALID